MRVGTCSVRKCEKCAQVFVVGIDFHALTDEYNSREYFAARNEYLAKWDSISAHFQQLVDVVKRYKSSGKFLDVGCSVGILLDVAQNNGFHVKGVEVSSWASEFARERGFEVTTGYLADACYPESFFDVVVLNHVLEHIPEPMAVIQETSRILKDDGLLVIGVPNFASLAARVYRENWSSLMPDQHIWQFTRQTLENLLRRQGFEIVHFEARDSHEVVGWRPKKVAMRLLNLVAKLTNNADAMLVIARKSR